MKKKELVKPIRLLELFSGIGAPRAALRNLGIPYVSVGSVEIDPKAVKSYNAIFKNDYVEVPQDISDWHFGVDVMVTGSPCQSFSISGKREGGEKDSGTQSSLLWHTIRIIEEMGSLKPKVVIWENVKNVLSKKMKPTFDQYISEMERLGYVSSYECLDAKDFGLPQRRPRVYTISILGGPKFDFSKLERKEMRPLSEFLDKEINEKYIANSEEIFKELYPYLLNQPSLIECLGKKGIRRTSIIDDCAYAITCRQDRSPAQVVKIEDNNYRFLTEKECWRLQGFSDEDFIAAKSVNPSREGYKSSILYKQAGNSMAVPVLEEIFDKLDLKERKESEVEKAKENKY